MHHLYFAFKVLPCKKNTHLQGNTIFYMKARLKIETRLLYPDQFLRRSCILKRPLLSAVNCVLQHFSTCRIQVHAYLKDVLHALHNCCFFQSKQWVGGCTEQNIVLFFRYNGLQAVLNKNWVYSLAIGYTILARDILSVNSILILFVCVMPD